MALTFKRWRVAPQRTTPSGNHCHNRQKSNNHLTTMEGGLYSYALNPFSTALYTLYRNTKLALILSDLASKRKCSLQGGIHSKYPTAPASLRKDCFGAMLHGCGCRIVVFCLLPPASFVTQIYRGVSGDIVDNVRGKPVWQTPAGD